MQPPSYTASYLIDRIVRRYISRYMGMLGGAVISMIFVALTTAALAWLIQPALDHVFVDKNTQMLLYVPLAVMALSFVKGAATYFQSVLMRNLGQRIVCDMQMELYRHLMHTDLAYFHAHSSGKLISRFTNDINLLRQSASILLTGIARELLTLICLIGLMFYQSWQLSVIALVLFPLAAHPLWRLGRRMRKLSRQTQDELGLFTSRLDESFEGIRIIKAYGREELEISRANALIERIYALFRKTSRVSSATSPLMETLAGLAIGGVIWYGGHQVLEGQTTPGGFFSFVTAMIMAYKPAKTIASLATNLQEGLAAAERLFSVLDARPSVTQSPAAQPLVVERGEVGFHRVSFRYQGAERNAIDQLNLTVPAGKKVALVGHSGGGKSTVFNLLLRFYDPDSGAITIDGQDIRLVTFASLRAHIGVVTQETVLFDDTVRANIAVGRDGATDAEIEEAARLANAHSFISELPQGYDTLIGQNGVMLSGGQRQRLAIARAMLKNAPILLLDEATSALDTISEQLIQQSLARLMEGRTTLVIAHRLSTIRDADIIYVLEKGRIVESGTHAELLARQQTYAALYHEEAQRPAPAV